jgi:bile acid:Na+ symporter, BASS family
VEHEILWISEKATVASFFWETKSCIRPKYGPNYWIIEVMMLRVSLLILVFTIIFQEGIALKLSSVQFRSSIRTSISRRSELLRFQQHQSSSHRIYADGNGLSNHVENKISIKQLLNKFCNLFPLWVLSFSLMGFKFPTTLKWFLPFVTPALTITMVGMGMTLTLQDFKHVLKSWKFVLVGFVAQYLIMPCSAFLSAKIFNLPPDLASGLILVGCAPGGTASNLVTLIAKADLALSILMTMASTIAAVFMTPFLVTKLAGSFIQVKSSELVFSTCNVVLLPVLFGLFFNTKFPKASSAVSDYTPAMSVILVAMICGSISASNSHVVKYINGFQLILATILLHVLGFSVGYLFSKYLFQANEEQARTISIETGMQNSALAVVLAQKHFPNPMLSSLPGAISATCHSLIGSLLAAIWRSQNTKSNADSQTKANNSE